VTNFNEQIFNALLDPKNPVYISLAAALLLFVTIYFFYNYGIKPIKEKHKSEKEDIELKSSKMMALFAQLDPDPVIRIDHLGQVVETNQAAQNVFYKTNLAGKNISEILTDVNISANSTIKTETRKLTKKIGEKHFSILYRGDADLNLAQIYFRDISEIKKYEETLLDYQAKLKNLSEHLHEIIEDERKRISIGLHDGIGQSLSLLRIKLIRLQEDIGVGEQTNYFQESIGDLENIIKELKEITYSLKPKLLSETGLYFAIKSLIENVNNSSGIIGEINISGKEKRLEEKLELTIFRIVQESINNILKHSYATNYSMQLFYSRKVFRLIVTDNGIGFKVNSVLKNKLNGMGLVNIKERIENYNGIFKIESLKNKGTMLVVEVPLTKEV